MGSGQSTALSDPIIGKKLLLPIIIVTLRRLALCQRSEDTPPNAPSKGPTLINIYAKKLVAKNNYCTILIKCKDKWRSAELADKSKAKTKVVFQAYKRELNGWQ